MNKQQKQQLKDLLKPVEKVDLQELLPEYLFGKQQSFGIVVTTPKGPKLVNTCSKTYELVPNSKIIEPLFEAFEGHDLDIITSSRFDSRFSLDIVFKDIKVSVGKGDEICGKLRMYNSYDGRLKYQFHMGFFRMICKNGMVLPAQGFEDRNQSLKMRHTPSLTEYVDTARLLDMIGEFKSSSKDFIMPFKELQNQRVDNIEERVSEVIKATKFPSRQMEEVVSRIQIEMGELKVKHANDWLVYNGMNYQLNHNTSLNMDAAKKELIDQQVLTQLLK
jgi:hypothetical protein